MQPIDYTAVSTSYLGGAGNGEGPLDPKAFGCPESLQFCVGGGSEDGTLFAIAYPSGKGYCTWSLRFYVSTTGAELANAQSAAGVVFKLWGFGV
jgi:hypothetical protein